MGPQEYCHVQYVFSDVEQFTRKDRGREAQFDIIEALNAAFMGATADIPDKIFLPTGDGICLGIVGARGGRFDLNLLVAVEVLKRMHEWSLEQKPNRKCRVRIGIHEAVDQLITDINGKPNIVGPGINHAQRVMSLADGNQIVVSQGSFDSLTASESYRNRFHPFVGPAKLRPIQAYQFRDGALAASFLNVSTPSSVFQLDAIDLDLNAAAEALDSNEYPKHCELLQSAMRKWKIKIDALFKEAISHDPYSSQLHATQMAWEGFNKIQGKHLSKFEAEPPRPPSRHDQIVTSLALEELRHRAKMLESLLKLHSNEQPWDHIFDAPWGPV